MTKSRLIIYITAGLILMVAVLSLPFQVGQVQGERLAQQTWPSRTPTPEGGPVPTNTSQSPPPTDDPGNPPQSTATPQPGATAPPGDGPSPTPTTAATVVLQTPEGGYVATAQPCGEPPTVQARGMVNVRQGPGLDYEPIDSLIFLEVRPIIGRAENATWWQIQLPDEVVGWVADQAVTVQGYTGAVPVVEPPELNGATPTPGPTWQPTPNPSCTPMPTATPSRTPEPEEEEAAVATTAPVSNTEPTETPPEPTETETPTPTDTAAAEPESTATPPASPTDAVSPINPDELPDDLDGPESSPSSWILFIGIGLVVIGAATFFLRSR